MNVMHNIWLVCTICTTFNYCEYHDILCTTMHIINDKSQDIMRGKILAVFDYHDMLITQSKSNYYGLKVRVFFLPLEKKTLT